MTLLSGLHHHQMVVGTAIECFECEHHVHHPGHLTATTSDHHDCLLCQFLSLVYTPAALLAVGSPVSPICVVRPFSRCFVCSGTDLHKPSRAPPFIL